MTIPLFDWLADCWLCWISDYLTILSNFLLFYIGLTELTELINWLFWLWMFDYLIVIDRLNNWYVEPLNDADYPPKAFGGILGS